MIMSCEQSARSIDVKDVLEGGIGDGKTVEGGGSAS